MYLIITTLLEKIFKKDFGVQNIDATIWIFFGINLILLPILKKSSEYNQEGAVALGLVLGGFICFIGIPHFFKKEK